MGADASGGYKKAGFGRRLGIEAGKTENKNRNTVGVQKNQEERIMKKIIMVLLFAAISVTGYSYPREIRLTKSEGAYIRSNFAKFFGKNKACQYIGRTHVNFPEIYDGGRDDLVQAMLKSIWNTGALTYGGEASEEVKSWYYDNCVTYNNEGAGRSKALKYFYNYVSTMPY